MQLIIDIFDNHNLIEKFCNINNLHENDYDNLLKSYLEHNDFPLYIFNDEQSQEYIDFNKLKIGDSIKVNYIPFSQKYIDYYENKNVKGKIFYIDTLNHNGLVYYDIIENNKIIRYINSIAKEYCSYYGDSPGYNMFIYKLI